MHKRTSIRGHRCNASLTSQGDTKQLANVIKKRSRGYKSKNMCNMFTINTYKFYI